MIILLECVRGGAEKEKEKERQPSPSQQTRIERLIVASTEPQKLAQLTDHASNLN